MNKDKQHLLTLDYLNTKLTQAQKDVELFSLLLEEILSLQQRESRAILDSKFARVIALPKGDKTNEVD